MTTGVAGAGVIGDMIIEDVVMMDGATIDNGQAIKKRRIKRRFLLPKGFTRWINPPTDAAPPRPCESAPRLLLPVHG